MWILEKTAEFVKDVESPLTGDDLHRTNVETSYDHGLDRWRVEFFFQGVVFGCALFEDRGDYLYYADGLDEELQKELGRILVDWAKFRKSYRSPGFVSDFDDADEIAVDWYFQSFGLA